MAFHHFQITGSAAMERTLASVALQIIASQDRFLVQDMGTNLTCPADVLSCLRPCPLKKHIDRMTRHKRRKAYDGDHLMSQLSVSPHFLNCS